MNDEAYEPWVSYAQMRDAEQDGLRHQVTYPVVGGVVGLFVVGFIGKYARAIWIRLKKAWGQAYLSRLLAPYNAARGIDGLSSLHGPIRLNFPQLCVGGVSLNVDGAAPDTERPDVLHLRASFDF